MAEPKKLVAPQRKNIPSAGEIIMETENACVMRHPKHGVIIEGVIRVEVVDGEPVIVPAP